MSEEGGVIRSVQGSRPVPAEPGPAPAAPRGRHLVPIRGRGEVARLREGTGRPESLRILLLSETPGEAEFLARLLARFEQPRYRITRISGPEEALSALRRQEYDACLVDHELAARSDFSLLRAVRASGIEQPVLLLADGLDAREDILPLEAGALDVVEREQLDPGTLDRALRFAVARARERARLVRLIRYDTLTSVLNVDALVERLRWTLAAARRHRTRFAVAIIDLPELAAGCPPADYRLMDLLLNEAARRLQQTLRATDAIARTGPREFTLLLTDLSCVADAALVVTKVLDALTTPDSEDAPALHPRIGVALYPTDAERPEELLELAGRALAGVPATAQVPVRFHDPHIQHHLRRGPIGAAELQTALARGELELRFQPQVTLASGPVGVAASASWPHPRYGEIEARVFRTLAERSGLLEPLTRWMIEAAVTQAAEWERHGLGPFHLAVPLLSRRQLAWSDLAEFARRCCEDLALAPQRLEFEVPEPLLLEELAAGGRAFEGLAASGIRLAVEDFGGGVASLRLLRDVPLHTVKLSRRLLAGTPRDERRRLFVDAVIALAKTLGLRLVADGAETAEQLQMLRRAGCDAVQALMSCPPLPAGAARCWLRQARRRKAPG